MRGWFGSFAECNANAQVPWSAYLTDFLGLTKGSVNGVPALPH